MALFAAPTVSNYCWCFHVFNSAPATCQYFFCHFKILITIRENMGGEKILEKPSNQSPKIGQFESTMNFHTAF